MMDWIEWLLGVRKACELPEACWASFFKQHYEKLPLVSHSFLHNEEVIKKYQNAHSKQMNHPHKWCIMGIIQSIYRLNKVDEAPLTV